MVMTSQLTADMRAAREAKGLSQADMATLVGYAHRTSYTKIELGYSRPSFKTAFQVARILGVNPLHPKYEGGRDDA